MAWGRRRWASANADAVRRQLGDDHVNVTAAAWTRSAADALRGARRDLVNTNQDWQRELWDYYETCGEYNLSVTWRSNMISRVRLRAAELRPGLDEPVIVDAGPAAELVAEFFGDVNGQSDALAALSTYLDVPGEGWVIGEHVSGLDRGEWRTCSRDEIRSRGTGYEVVDENSSVNQVRWRDLAPDSLVTRVWRPHRRMHHMPYSPAKSARGAIRELELVNRHIQAQYLSRLASAGIVVLPEELTFPTREEFNDAPDPFVAEWIATAKQAIEQPGTAAAVVPIPMRVPAEYVDKVHHIDFTLKIDEKIIEKRESARHRLAGIINVPTELLFDTRSINHWGLWQLEESGVKTYLTPDVELICGALTQGYLRPLLRARGVEQPRRWVVWYDLSEIVSRPNITDNVIKAYDRLEVTGQALRRVIGLTEEDKPSKAEVQDLALMRLAIAPQTGFTALHELTGLEVETGVGVESPAATGVGGPAEANPPPAKDGPVSGPPNTSDQQPRVPRDATSAELDPGHVAFTILQASSTHVVEFSNRRYVLKHPLLCASKLFSCPFAHAVHAGIGVHPGTSGDYECTLSPHGDLVIGRRVYPSSDALLSDPPRGVNGVRVGA